MQIPKEKYFGAAYGGYLAQLQVLVRQYPKARILELGGGRWPGFPLSDMPDTIESYTVNDISQSELDVSPPEYDKACFDVTGDVSKFAGSYDVVFSRSLAEHVKDGEAMHRNVHSLLRPGGVAFHLIPTLYALPFVINKLTPETLSRKLLLALFPRRREASPKFPAHYSWCYGSPKKMTRLLKSVGFSDVSVRDFYGHEYYDPIPGLKQLGDAFAALAAKNDWGNLATYAYIIARK